MKTDPSLARKSIRELIIDEQRRARWYVSQLRKREPGASDDRLALLLSERFQQLAAVEGGVTGAFGLMGIPANLLFFTYSQVALVVAVAEAYRVPLDSEGGDDAVIDLIGEAHGIEDVVRATPRVLGALAKALTLRYGLGTLGRALPLLAAPISAHLNRRQMRALSELAIRRFGNVVMLR